VLEVPEAAGAPGAVLLFGVSRGKAESLSKAAVEALAVAGEEGRRAGAHADRQEAEASEAVSYRPITDTWILARPKVKYYGAYPSGFLHRARALLGVDPSQTVLHACAGRIRDYPFRGLGPNDVTVDIDPATKPDIVHDLREGIPAPPIADGAFWPAILIDRPYTEDDADHYATGRATLPNLNTLLKDALLWVPLGHRVGVLDYLWPHPGKTGTEVAVISVYTGRNNRVRTFTVFERIAAK
jgi:hypothetical protein